jgi:hypothetical protein
MTDPEPDPFVGCLLVAVVVLAVALAVLLGRALT